MDVARALAGQGAPDFTVVTADEQTAGRGRHGRVWYSPPGSAIYASVICRLPFAPGQLCGLTMAGALAVLDVVDASDPELRPVLKWFNDVQLNGRKIAGVLVEAAWMGDKLDYAILGLGVNVNTVFDHAPDDIRRRATSLCDVTGRVWDRDHTQTRLLAALHSRYARLPDVPLTDYTARLETLGRRIETASGPGIATGVGLDGALRVRLDDGSDISLAFGDVLSSDAHG
jgi:BirA family transcriptional regulator, biotin operon repressor / biotin---[acetyl-CoA-carboxylase] ligase